MQTTDPSTEPCSDAALSFRLERGLGDRDVRIDVARLSPGDTLCFRVSKSRADGDLVLSVSRGDEKPSLVPFERYVIHDDHKRKRDEGAGPSEATPDAPLPSVPSVDAHAPGVHKKRRDDGSGPVDRNPTPPPREPVATDASASARIERETAKRKYGFPVLEYYFGIDSRARNSWFHDSDERGGSELPARTDGEPRRPALICSEGASVCKRIWITDDYRVIAERPDREGSRAPEGCTRISPSLFSMDETRSRWFLESLLTYQDFVHDEPTAAQCLSIAETLFGLTWPTEWNAQTEDSDLPAEGSFRAEYSGVIHRLNAGDKVNIQLRRVSTPRSVTRPTAGRIELLRHRSDRVVGYTFCLSENTDGVLVTRREMANLCRRIASEATLNPSVKIALCTFVTPKPEY